ncbi:integrase core domain-containing protein, partial [Salipiger sp. 1_MG-2023]|uniref:integrase core domain-containing protein n=1 Tax=Salipiger sp. 1_MG-2023 TaxID=3062665 RepID=UPI0026E1E2BA
STASSHQHKIRPPLDDRPNTRFDNSSCVHRQRFESIQHAMRVIGDWIAFHNNCRPHQALSMRMSAEAFRLAA